MSKLNADELEQIQARAAEGKTVTEISAAVQRPRSTVASVLQRKNAPVPAPNGHASENATLDAILDEHWRSLSRPERLRRLLV
jgi:hypothetical protein